MTKKYAKKLSVFLLFKNHEFLSCIFNITKRKALIWFTKSL